MEKVQKIRDLERLCKDDIKNANNLISIRQVVSDQKESNDARISAVHALRRLIIHYVESGWFHRSMAGAKSSAAKKVEEYNKWFQNQFSTFKDCLIQLLSENEALHAVSIRTYMEMLKLDSVVESGPGCVSELNMESFRSLLVALIINKNELDVDLLLMLKEEIFSLHDCTYFSLLILKDLVSEVKDMHLKATERSSISKNANEPANLIVANFDTICKNFIDVYRVLSLPEEIDTDNVLIELVQPKKEGANGEDDSDAEGEVSSDEENEERRKAQQKDAVLQKMDPLLAELAGLKSAGARSNKRGLSGAGKASSKKARPAVSMYEKLQDVDYYQKAFSKAWLALLSLPFTAAQHKLLLKHLPEHVVPHMRNPLLLADYLSQSYATGGMVAVLALESLFHLIVNNNLDYPEFFLSLYNLCTVEVFTAKYRGKFMKLLSMSLKSTNLPAYLVAAFIKRLASLALHTPTPNSQFCIAQCTWLLRQHPQTQVLIHRKPKVASYGADGQVEASAADQFDNAESKDLEKANALRSSLWEAECLQNHHILAAAELARSLATAESTMIGAGAGDAYVHVEDYLSLGYADMMEAALGKHVQGTAAAKRSAALTYVKPTTKLHQFQDLHTRMRHTETDPYFQAARAETRLAISFYIVDKTTVTPIKCARIPPPEPAVQGFE